MATANATVMFTDIRGFTARTSRDTRVGLEELLRTHEQLLLPVIKHYDGRVVKTIGDAFLVVFESPTNAVHCGVVIQSRLREFNAEQPEEKKIEVRVAINSGEVALRGDDIFGEPVNIAARIEGITDPGEVYFTEATYLAMTKSEVPSSEVGTRRLKGIPEEIKLYKVLQDEDNELYKRILAQAGIVEQTAAASGSLSVPVWPPRRGRLQPSKAGGAMLLAWIAGIVVVAGAYWATQQWREAHRYDDARALIAAKNWRDARAEAGRLFNERAGDNQAVTLLGEAIQGELAALEAANDVRALDDAWQTIATGYPSLPNLPQLERAKKLASARMRVRAGETETALEALAQMHAADKSDAAVIEALTAALRADCEKGLEQLDPKTREAFDKRLAAHHEQWNTLPGWSAIRGDTWLAAGLKLVGASNGWVQQQGSNYLWAYLREYPDQPTRRSSAITALMAAGRFSSWKTLADALAADPKLAQQTAVRDGLLEWVGDRYDRDGEDWLLGRRLLLEHWAADVAPTLRQWLDEPKDPKHHGRQERRRMAAFTILDGQDQLTDAERDRHQAWVLLQVSNSSTKVEFLAALQHWQQLCDADPQAAATRGAAALPAPIDEIDALDRATWKEEDVDHGAVWRRVVGTCFYDRLQAAVTRIAVESRYPSEREAARLLLRDRGELTDALAFRSYLRDLAGFHERSYSGEAQESLEWFENADPAVVTDRGALREALANVLAHVGDRIAAIENAERLSTAEKRRQLGWWTPLRDRAEALQSRFAGD